MMLSFLNQVALDVLVITAANQTPTARKTPSAVRVAAMAAIDVMAAEVIVNAAAEAM
jgi:hypothetical protein